MHAQQADRREAPAALQQPLTASAQQPQQHQQQQRHSHDPTASPATAASSAPAQHSGLPDALPPAPHSYHYHHQHLAQLPAGGPAAAFASGPSVVYQHVWLGPTEAPPSAPYPPPGAPSAVQLLPHHYHLHQQHVHSHPYHHHHYHVHDPYLQHYRQQHPYHAYHLLVQQPHVHLHQHALHGFSPATAFGPPPPANHAPSEPGAAALPSTTTAPVPPAGGITSSGGSGGRSITASASDVKSGPSGSTPASADGSSPSDGAVPVSTAEKTATTSSGDGDKGGHSSSADGDTHTTSTRPARPTRHDRAPTAASALANEASQIRPPPGHSGRQLIVNYLDNDVTAAELTRIFSEAGRVEQARVMHDPNTNHPMGYGFVYMQTTEEASRAVLLFDQYRLRKKRLKVSFAINRKAPGR